MTQQEKKTEEKITVEYAACEAEYKKELITRITPISVKNNTKKLPFKMWSQIVAFTKYISKNLNTEVTMSLTLVKGKWVIIVWNQVTSGTLHVDYEENSKENTALKESLGITEALEKLHCTIHSHNKTSAFQSGTDVEDELPKNGWHITIGNCDKEEVSIHTRFNCSKTARFDEKGKKVSHGHTFWLECPISNIVATPRLPKELKGNTLTLVRNQILKSANDDSFPEEWKKQVTKPIPKTYPRSKRGLVQYGMMPFSQQELLWAAKPGR